VTRLLARPLLGLLMLLAATPAAFAILPGTFVAQDDEVWVHRYEEPELWTTIGELRGYRLVSNDTCDGTLCGDERLRIVAYTQPLHGLVRPVFRTDDNGVPTSEIHNLEYISRGGYAGDDTFTYTAVDIQTGEASIASVLVHVTWDGTDEPFPVTNDDVVGIEVCTSAPCAPVVIPVLDNDTLLESCAVSFNDGCPQFGDYGVSRVDSLDLTLTAGTVTIEPLAHRTVTYTPVPGFVGDDEFTYSVLQHCVLDTCADTGKDVPGRSAIVRVHVAPPANRPPTAADAAYQAVAGTQFAGSLSYGDPDGDPLTVSLVSGPTAGTLALTAPTFIYTPNGSSLTDAFTIEVSDGKGGSETATIAFTVEWPSTVLTITAPPATLAGAPLVVTAVLGRVTAPAGPVGGEAVAFTMTAADGSTTTISGTTDANGVASVTFTPTVRGPASIVAQFAGAAMLLPSTSPSASMAVLQRVAIAMAPVTGTADSHVMVNVTLATAPGGAPVTGEIVTFSFGGVVPDQAAVTGPDGVATIVVAFPGAGAFTASASFANAPAFFTNHSGATPAAPETASAAITIAAAATNLSSLMAPASAQSGDTLPVSTVLTRISAPAGPVANAQLVFTVNGPGGSTTTIAGTTDFSGVASVSVPFTMGGTYTITAQFAGSSSLQLATSNTAAVAVTSLDSTAPVITPGINGTLGANGWYTGNVNVSWTVTDPDSAISFQAGCDPTTISTDGASLPVTCTATSDGGTSYRTVTIARDATPPSIATSPNLSVAATGAAGATVNYAPASAADATSGLASTACAPATLSTFAIGTTMVTCTASDLAGNTAAASFAVTVGDPTAPVITPAVTGALGANGWYTSDVVVTWSVSDPESGISNSTGCAPATTNTDGASFTMTCTATSAGGTSTQSVTFKRDASAPGLAVPANATATAAAWDGANVTYAAPSATDATSGIAWVSCAPPSGSTFPIGVTTVSCVATNNAGLTKAGTFTVTVVDRSGPGRMSGEGAVPGTDNHRVEFDFTALENRRGNEWGNVKIKVRDSRRRRGDDERFDARTVDTVTFSDAPGYGPGRNARTGVDTVVFGGTGRWDGRPGYAYVVTASDRGEPGRGRDTFTIAITSPTGAVVFTGGGTLTDGNVQSSRLDRPAAWWNGRVVGLEKQTGRR
jgi:hypothetical protein